MNHPRSLIPTPPLPRMADGSSAGKIVMRCLGSGVDGEFGVFVKGELRQPSDPLVKRHPALFERWTPPALPVKPLDSDVDGPLS